jgi:hypothetical protein
MTMPGFNASVSVYKTSESYFTILRGPVTGARQVFLQQVPRSGLGACIAGCNPNAPDFGFGCIQRCLEDFGPGGEPGPGGGGGPRVIESCGCFRNPTSPTGRRQRCRVTVPGFGGTIYWGDECPAPRCGPCICTRTCVQRCLRYTATGRPMTYTRPCLPPIGFPVPPV